MMVAKITVYLKLKLILVPSLVFDHLPSAATLKKPLLCFYSPGEDSSYEETKILGGPLKETNLAVSEKI